MKTLLVFNTRQATSQDAAMMGPSDTRFNTKESARGGTLPN